ncbi:uncharacterized protein FIBRA_06008 [Fibroporia radiculosa]|uniref:AIG1-type G domain-containing protein n=1 Tax=Fibroporia radiculosa TaxID=599839 RepID=J4GAH7_9APHY|nr:uncharacterized protein FIBRA_06008 [Fibroporia radiculosa]CCM03858.1 predicted protein [Fibroporia radiculosa]
MTNSVCKPSQQCIVDTPGFDDTERPLADVLNQIANFLKEQYEKKTTVAAMIFTYRISDNRMSGTGRENFRLFRKICGDAAMKNAAIVTTMWTKGNQAVEAAREEQLRTNFFRDAMDRGASLYRHDNTQASARKILLDTLGKMPKVLRVQEELVDQHKSIPETDAGMQLFFALNQEEREYKKQLEVLDMERKRLSSEQHKAHRQISKEGDRRGTPSKQETISNILEDFQTQYGILQMKIQKIQSEKDTLGSRGNTAPSIAYNTPDNFEDSLRLLREDQYLEEERKLKERHREQEEQRCMEERQREDGERRQEQERERVKAQQRLEERQCKEEQQRAEEQRRVEEEKRCVKEEQQRVKEKRRRVEEEQQHAEKERRRMREEQRRVKEEQQHVEEEQRRLREEEQRRLREEEQQRIEEEQRRVEEEKRRVEEEQRHAEKEQRRVEEEQRRVEEEQRRVEEERRIEEEQQHAKKEQPCVEGQQHVEEQQQHVKKEQPGVERQPYVKGKQQIEKEWQDGQIEQRPKHDDSGSGCFSWCCIM